MARRRTDPLDIDIVGTVDNTCWFGPLEPLLPVAPREVTGRRFDYAPGWNLVTSPRGLDGQGHARIPFAQLRALAENYDLLRLVIETRKDELVRCPFAITPRDKKKTANDDPRVPVVTTFLERPDREHSWDQWLRVLLEDMLVLDAPAIYPRKARNGGLYALDCIDGATIKPVIDDHGRRPLPPAPAYQQVLHGLPAVDYEAVPDQADGQNYLSAAQLIYLPRNLRADHVYGFSPVEQIVMSVNIALRRQLHILQYYTEGTMPDALVGAPDSWGPQQIWEFQAMFDALLADNTAERRKVRFVPGGIAKGFVQTKEQALTGETDEWLARLTCYAFSVSPQPFVKMMNRATAETAQDQALQEGLGPHKQWVKSVIDAALRIGWGYDDLELTWPEEKDVDPALQAKILDDDLARGAITIDEHRAAKGRDPYPDGLGAKPIIYLAAGAVLLSTVVNPPEQPDPADLAAPGGAGGNPPGGEGGEDGEDGPDQRLEKAAAGSPPARAPRAGGPDLPAGGADRVFERPPGVLNAVSAGGTPAEGDAPLLKADRPARQGTESALLKVWSDLLQGEGVRIAQAIESGRPLAKAAGDDDGDQPIELDPEAWAAAEAASRAAIEGMALDGAGDALATLGISDDGITSLANPRAVAWAKAHAAELVSQVSDTTRARLNELVAQSADEGWSVQQLAQSIREDSIFSTDRAQKIAQHETREADNQGALASMKAAKQAGVETEKSWQPRGGNVCAACEANGDDGWIDVDNDFNSGDDASPMHPGCECDTEYRVKGDH